MNNGQKTTVPKKNRMHQQNIFGGVNLTHQAEDSVQEIFEEDNAIEQLKAQKMKMFQENKKVLKDLNSDYLKTAANRYKIDGNFKPNDVILSHNLTDIIENTDLILNINSPLLSNASPTMNGQNNKKAFAHKRDSALKGSDSTYSGTPESQIPEMNDQKLFNINLKEGEKSSADKPTNYTEIMMKRWKKVYVNELPSNDKIDCKKMVDPKTKTSELR